MKPSITSNKVQYVISSASHQLVLCVPCKFTVITECKLKQRSLSRRMKNFKHIQLYLLLPHSFVFVPWILKYFRPSYRCHINTVTSIDDSMFQSNMSDLERKTLNLQHNLRGCFLRDFRLRDVLTGLWVEDRAFLRCLGFAMVLFPGCEQICDRSGAGYVVWFSFLSECKQQTESSSSKLSRYARVNKPLKR